MQAWEPLAHLVREVLDALLALRLGSKPQSVIPGDQGLALLPWRINSSADAIHMFMEDRVGKSESGMNGSKDLVVKF